VGGWHRADRAGFGYARGLNPLRRALATALAALALAAPARRARGATDTTVRLEYQADPQAGCAGEDELRRMVSQQLGRDPFRPDADQEVEIELAKTDGGFQGRIVWRDADGRRVGERLLSSRSRECQEIAANVAFAVALQLQLVEQGGASDAEAAAPNAGAPEPKPPEIVAPPPVVPERPSAPTPNPGPEPATPPMQLAVGAGPSVGFGMAPEATAFGRLFVMARSGRLSAEIAADASLSSTLRESDGTGVVVSARGASAAGCAHVSVASTCLLGRLAWLRARGTGVAEPSSSWGRFGELGLRVGGTESLGRVTVSLHADLLVVLSRWNVVLSDAVVWEVPRIGGMVGVDVAARFF
jgi:hypothetical protein